MNVYDKIAAQQGKKYTNVWRIGQQLAGILHADPSLEEIVDKDLDVPEMSLSNCEKKVKARVDEIHEAIGGNCVAFPDDEAEAIIRKFYGLPEIGTTPAAQPVPVAPAADDDDVLDLGDFL